MKFSRPGAPTAMHLHKQVKQVKSIAKMLLVTMQSHVLEKSDEHFHSHLKEVGVVAAAAHQSDEPHELRKAWDLENTTNNLT